MYLKFKQSIKMCIPHKVLVEYRWLRNKMVIYTGKKCHRLAFKSKKKTGDIIIVFIVYLPQLWNSLRTVYEAAVKHPDVVPYVIVTGGASVSDNSQFSALDYFKSVCMNVIDCTDGNQLFDLNTIQPDFVFRQTPYDSVYPKDYSIQSLSKISKTCYVPYNYNFSPDKHLKIEYGIKALANLYVVFSESVSNAEYLRSQVEKLHLDLQVFNLGFPRFDLIKENSIKCRTKANVFTWIPRWSVDDVNNDATSFFKYNEKLTEYFRLHKQLKLIIRPHPLMFNNFVRLGAMTGDEVREYKEKIDKEKNIFLDNNIDYLETFACTDALIADMSSINYEFYLMGKPMIYCGDPLEYNAETKKMMECSYVVSNWMELENRIKQLSNGIDSTFDEREKDIQNIFSNMPKNIGESIINKCVSIMR